MSGGANVGAIGAARAGDAGGDVGLDASRALFARDALLPGGWARDVLLGWDGAGTLTSVEPDATPPRGVASAAGPVVPGMPNLHSHAFQRGFAGLAEFRAGQGDSFWSWRALMYRFARRIDPARLEAIATWLYVEMIECGYTSVCEFHYVHHREDGTPYVDDAETSRVLLRAARRAGIGITLLPVLYQAGGFGAAPPSPDQRRFIRSDDSIARLLETLAPACSADGARLGLAPHSLRAVPPAALARALDALRALDPGAPVHVHVAEQAREVDECVAWSGLRPVEWLLEHVEVDARWCLVHATHMSADETRRAAATGAVAGLCPSTEANLGDGVFDFAGWRDAGGAWGVGSDSHVCVDPAQELMLLEYGQRLVRGARAVAAVDAHPQVADAMWLAAVAGGARACGRRVAGLARGERADFAVLDAGAPALAGLPGALALAGHVFASGRSRGVDAVWCGGRRRVAAGRHELHEEALAAFVAARAVLFTE